MEGKETNVILSYKRPSDNWLCSECDTENSMLSVKCTLCGTVRTPSVAVLNRWTPPPAESAPPRRTPPRPTPPGMSAPPPPYSPSYGGPGSHGYAPGEKRSSAGLIVGIIAVLFVIVVIIISIATSIDNQNSTYGSLTPNDNITYECLQTETMAEQSESADLNVCIATQEERLI